MMRTISRSKHVIIFLLFYKYEYIIVPMFAFYDGDIPLPTASEKQKKKNVFHIPEEEPKDVAMDFIRIHIKMEI